MSKQNYVLSGEIETTPEVYQWMQRQINGFFQDREKAIRLFFLMAFRIPLACSEGKKSCYFGDGRTYYLYNNIPLAVESVSEVGGMKSMLTLDAQYDWLAQIPMKQFKMFGTTYTK